MSFTLENPGDLPLSSHLLHLFRGSVMPATPAHSCPHLLALPPHPASVSLSCRPGPGSECLCQALEGASADVPSCCCHSGRDVWLGIGRRTKQVWVPGMAGLQGHEDRNTLSSQSQSCQLPKGLTSFQYSSMPPAEPAPERLLHWLFSGAWLPYGSRSGGTRPLRSSVCNWTCFKALF